RYIVALYWAMYTFLTVGYGDITIVNTAEKIWAIITAITGVVMAGWFMGAVGTFMGGTGGREADILQRRQDVFLFIQKRHLRGRLASRLQHYQDSIMWRELTDSDRDIINGLPRMLRTELVLHLYDKVVQKVLFMQTRPPQLVVELLLRLRLQLYEKDEYVVREGEIGSEIFFLARESAGWMVGGAALGCPSCRDWNLPDKAGSVLILRPCLALSRRASGGRSSRFAKVWFSFPCVSLCLLSVCVAWPQPRPRYLLSHQ
ncbi:hypothetical protein Vretimale_8336, partial [Volvox reticuliferus]